jgi:hypothetical protein
MEQVTIWYLTDNDKGKEIALSIRDLGLRCNLIIDGDFQEANILPGERNLFIVDSTQREVSDILSLACDDSRLHEFLKYVILYKRQIRKALNMSFNQLHLEFISRPVNKNEFILLLEKSIIIERYREMLRFFSREADERIEAYENLLNMSRKDIFESEREKKSFLKIMEYEKHLREEEEKLNVAIEEFSYIRRKELFDVKNKISSGEVLSDLRRRERFEEVHTPPREEIIEGKTPGLIESERDTDQER